MRVRLSRRREAQTPGIRRTRITCRCLSGDLGETLPAAEVDIGTIEHPVMRQARELTSSHPANLARVQAIDDALVVHFMHGRDRVASWLDESTATIWVCAVDDRGEATDDYFSALHGRGELLPGEDDVRREQVETAARLVAAIRAGVPRWLDEARVRPNRDVTRSLPGGATLRVFRPRDADEFWVAMPILGTPGALAPRMRAVLVAVLQEHLGEIAWEQRYDWPRGELPYHEIAVLGRR